VFPGYYSFFALTGPRMVPWMGRRRWVVII
jgi:hypothetical protein